MITLEQLDEWEIQARKDLSDVDTPFLASNGEIILKLCAEVRRLGYCDCGRQLSTGRCKVCDDDE